MVVIAAVVVDMVVEEDHCKLYRALDVLPKRFDDFVFSRGGNNSLPHRNRDGSGSEMTGGTATIQQQVVDVSGDPNAIGTFGDEAGEKDFTGA